VVLVSSFVDRTDQKESTNVGVVDGLHPRVANALSVLERVDGCFYSDEQESGEGVGFGVSFGGFYGGVVGLGEVAARAGGRGGGREIVGCV